MNKLFKKNFWTRAQPLHLHQKLNKLIKKPLINNQIRSNQVRVIDETGNQLGVMDLTKALQLSRERNLDLIQVTEKTDPPVCKITDYGKYLYAQEKKHKKQKKVGELKGMRIGYNISPHDLEIKANQIENFLNKGNKVKIDMLLRGREKALGNFAKQKMNQLLELLKEKVEFKVEKELKRKGSHFTMIISK